MDGNEWFRATDEEEELALLYWKDPERRTNEDWLLLKYWREAGGVIITEVPIGRGGPREWPPGAKTRRIDGVRLVAPPPTLSDGIHAFGRDTNRVMVEILIAGARVEVIEVKQDLNRPVLGQVIAGADLLEMEYAPAQVDPVVVCAVGDPARSLPGREHIERPEPMLITWVETNRDRWNELTGLRLNWYNKL